MNGKSEVGFILLVECLYASPDGRATTHIAKKIRYEKNSADLIFAAVWDEPEG